MYNRTRGRKQDNEQAEALARREQKRKTHQQAEEFAALITEMMGE